MERTATIPLWEYDNLRETVKRLTDERTAAEKRNVELESQLSQIRDIVAPAEESEGSGGGCDNPSGAPFSECLTALSKAGSRYEYFDPTSVSRSASGDLANCLWFHLGSH